MGRRSIVQRELLPLPPGGVPSNVGALGNWVFIQDTPHTQTQTNTSLTGVPVLAAAIQRKFSGTVRIDCHARFNSNTTAKLIDHNVIITPFSNVTSRFAGAGTGTIDSNGVALGRDVAPATAQQTPSFWAAALSADATGLPADSMTFNGGPIFSPGNSITFATSGSATLTGLLTAQSSAQWSVHYSGMAPNLNALIPNQAWTSDFLVVALMLLSTNGGDVITYTSASITVQEQPLP